MAKVKMYGPSVGRLFVAKESDGSDSREADGRLRWSREPPFETEARTLGEALNAYDATFGTRTEKYDGSDPEVPLAPGELKYFWHSGVTLGRSEKFLVDVHIDRRSANICRRQDLEFLLEDGDTITLGPLAC